MKRRTFSQRTHKSVIAILLTCSTVLPAFARADHNKHSNGAVNIDNFGQVNDHIYRGSQPSEDNYRQLASIGVKTILDLRGEAKSSRKSVAEAAGLRYINLPLEDKKLPSADAAERFLSIVNDQANWPVYVHCAGGRHRTGSMVAVYRMTVDHWTLAQAYAEMEQYDFYTSNGHGCYKEYVNGYYNNLQSQHLAHSSVKTQPAVESERRF